MPLHKELQKALFDSQIANVLGQWVYEVRELSLGWVDLPAMRIDFEAGDVAIDLAIVREAKSHATVSQRVHL